LRNQIGFVTQDTQLFAGTIKENLLFVNPSATEEDLQLALKNQAVPLFWNVLKTELIP
jgi:ATP-binding cassette subfamily B protein